MKKDYIKDVNKIVKELMTIISTTISTEGTQKRYDTLIHLTIAINKEAVAMPGFGGKSSKAQKVLDIF